MSEELTDEDKMFLKNHPRMQVICELSCFHNIDGVCRKRGNLHIKRYEPTPFGYMAYCSDYKEKMR
jgi:hypothetical protein